MDAREIACLLGVAREAAQASPLCDVHAHPFEVFSGERGYAPKAGAPGLFGRSSLAYLSPTPAPFQEKPPGSEAVSPAGTLLQARLLYGHTGPRVFREHMAACGISRCLLLPVARTPADAEEQMGEMTALFGDAPDLVPGAPLPPGLPLTGIAAFLRAARTRHRARAVKVHPNLTGIDLGRGEGRSYLEAALSAAGELGLPVVIHAGRSPGMEPGPRSAFSAIENLSRVDWAAAGSPVVLAHGGLFGLSPAEREKTALPLLRRMIDRWERLFVDTSGLDRSGMGLLLDGLPRERILFGSDSLYYPPWRGVVTLLSALSGRSASLLQDFSLIASKNPCSSVFLDTPGVIA